MSIQLNIDVKRLYRLLCDKCQPKLLELIEIRPDRSAILRILQGDKSGGAAPEVLGLQERMIIEHRDKDGNLLGTRDSGWSKNGITNAGMAEVAGLITSDVGGTAFDHIAIGTGTTAFNAAQTALVTETHREAGTGTRVTTTVTNDTSQLVHKFEGYAGSEAVTEGGEFNAAAAGTMIMRQVFAAINVDWDAGDSLTVTIKIQVKQGA